MQNVWALQMLHHWDKAGPFPPELVLLFPGEVCLRGTCPGARGLFLTPQLGVSAPRSHTAFLPLHCTISTGMPAAF